MPVVVASQASDAAENLADSLNRGSITGWDLLAAVLVIVVSVPIARMVSATIKQALKRAGIASDDTAVDIGMVARWLVYLFACALAASILVPWGLRPHGPFGPSPSASGSLAVAPPQALAPHLQHCWGYVQASA